MSDSDTSARFDFAIGLGVLMMLTALILVCSAAVTPDVRDCTHDNATAVMRIPAEFGNPATCLMHGQAYLAETSIGQALGNDDLVRVVCRPTARIDASMPAPNAD
jgi:hypothetical protein